MINGTMMEYFHEKLPKGCKLWNKVYDECEYLNKLGITALWLPPAYKGMFGNSDVGYAVYDLYDLGEFDQKGSISTKYGYKDEYINAIDKLHKNNIQVYGDIVLNHKMGADFTEEVECYEFDCFHRNNKISEEKNITAWTKFDFKNRNNKYSSFKWNYNHFSAVDYDEKTKRNSIYKFKDKCWSEDVDKENDNYDYLMGCDIDFSNKEVVEQLNKWGKWYVDIANLDGFRLDAIKHISRKFYKGWLREVRKYTHKELFSVGEYWHYDVNVLLDYINNSEGEMSLFDVPLHYNFYEASHNENYDMRSVFNNTLVNSNPIKAVTFVDNHDTEIGGALESWIEPWFKAIAYGLILLREQGYPCVFFGDFYGVENYNYYGIKKELEKILYVRSNYAYGKQNDYFDDKKIIGWTREGEESVENSGVAVLISTGNAGEKDMYIGEKFSGKIFIDIMNNKFEEVKINKNGVGKFVVSNKNISIWILKTEK